MASTGDRNWRVLLAAALLFAGAAALSAYIWAPSPRPGFDPADQEAARAAWCVRASRLAEGRERVVDGRGAETVSVVGDSYTTGFGLRHPDHSWTRTLAQRLGARVYAFGFGGTGFTGEAGNCPGKSFADRVAEALAVHPSLVIIEGGLNEVDTDPAALRPAVVRLARRMADTPFWIVGPTLAPALTAEAGEVDRRLSRICGDLGVPYVRASGWQLEYGADGVHLTEAGHQRFGTLVAQAVRSG